MHCTCRPRAVNDLSAVEQQLDDYGGLEDGVGEILRRQRKGDTEIVRKIAKKLSKDVDQLKKEKEEYSVYVHVLCTAHVHVYTCKHI